MARQGLRGALSAHRIAAGRAISRSASRRPAFWRLPEESISLGDAVRLELGENFREDITRRIPADKTVLVTIAWDRHVIVFPRGIAGAQPVVGSLASGRHKKIIL